MSDTRQTTADGVQAEDTGETARGCTAAELESAMAEQLRCRPDFGLWLRLGNLLLEPRNPFDPAHVRAPKKDAVVIGLLLLAAVMLVVYFNLTASR